MNWISALLDVYATLTTDPNQQRSTASSAGTIVRAMRWPGGGDRVLSPHRAAFL
jgi:hypothetical protein